VTELRVGGRTVTITHPERVLFPDDGFTKADLVQYHLAVAEHLLRHARDRPLMLQRFPEGIGEDGFYQKDVGRGVPGWIPTVQVDKSDGTVTHPVLDGPAALVALTNLSTVSLHRWNSRVDHPDRPDLLIVDLDPSGEDLEPVRRAAHRVRELFDELELAAYLQVTGSRGIHVVSPLDRSAGTEAVVAFAAAVARVLAARYPDELTDEFRTAKRRGRLYVDVGRNGWAQTSISPYSVRPRRGAPVATPIRWDELDDPDLRADRWTLATVPARLDEHGDPWAELSRHGRSLHARAATLQVLLERTSR
jgi:bifunctional non-homologous end joining protein LigD